ncbi:hypothetical protein GCM10009119_09750 [Algoriphagus jejuensis]|uniref:GWxTD domain-containing protein n=2 Tax=Algoriphagus jejuensis TaxID=419934 RepID=A0ABN1MX27_9BACT
MREVMMMTKVWIFLLLLIGVMSMEQAAAKQTGMENESVSFSTPKTLYFTGEKIWIDAAVLLGENPTTSQVLYAELVNRDSKSMGYVKMPLIDGKSFNYFQLKNDLPSDHYLLRVYTRISPYLDQELGIAQQFVTVINPSSPPTGGVGESNIRPTPPRAAGSFSKNQKITVPSSNNSGAKVQMGISLANPYLTSEQEQISSSRAYESLRKKDLVPELFGHIVEVNVPNAMQDATYFISVHGTQSALFTDIPNADGRVLVDVGGLKHWDRLIIQLEDGAEMPGIEVVLPLIETSFRPGFDFPKLSLEERDLPRLEQLLKASRVETYYSEEYLRDSMEVVVGFVADHSYNLDDYTRFDDVETVLREYVPSVMVRTRDKKKEFRLVDEAVKRMFDTNPLILVDAMPVFDSNLLASFNPKFMTRLEVLNREFYLNQRTYHGVLSWSSYENNFGLFPLAPSARFFDYYGLQPKIEMDLSQFSTPDQNQRYPDWRTVLYWGDDSAGLSAVQAPDLDGLFIFWTRTVDASGKAQVSRNFFSIVR